MSLLAKAQAELAALTAEAERLSAERHRLEARLAEIDARRERLRDFIDVGRQLDASVTENSAASDDARAEVERPQIMQSSEPRSRGQTAVAANSPFFGLSIRNAVLKCLVMQRRPMTCKDITEELAVAGFTVAAKSLGDSVNYALRQLEQKGEVTHLGRALWGVPPESDETPKLAPNRDAIEHAVRTREGLRVAQERGVRLGRADSMTPELAEKAKELLAQGKSIGSIRNETGVSRTRLYRWLKETGLSLQNAEATDADEVAPVLFPSHVVRRRR